ncbi:MAG TPA: alpha/beta hydrolase [Spirochaetota bacterium]|jgi:pimeloyl-ACP methyl ester carboxylesterase|nr:MAG: Lipase 3 precursor [Spirochaetes bacterium ADurb.Bin133]HNZ27646.1 alpha/beta hydrolase [Spirochaetota bacterium]HPY87823.1 alpha/beta hydrolase [Spirochaetota bacterium]HQB61054.1 alpha/beta hydrolase [Spirochaetota bacterium]
MKKKSIEIFDYKIFYLDNEKFDSKPLLFVHGWGADKDNLRAVYQKLEGEYRVISIDLPGFGESSTPKEVIGSDDYAGIIVEFLNKLNINQISYIGHSFGGKLGLVLAGNKMFDIQNLVLIDSSGVKPKRGVVWYIKVYFYKIMKFIYSKFVKDEKKIEAFRNKFGSDDYKNAGDMQKIFVKIVNEDYTYILDKISCPTFIYWGEKDRDTPLWMAKLMHNKIKDSGLFVVKNGGHYSFLADDRISSIIRELVK